ncbi:hypothetical protein ACSMXN_03730 [Jatrophihabitans sp. DSM 45814]
MTATSVVVGGLSGADRAAADPTPLCSNTTCTVDFALTGSPQLWVVPAGVASVTVTIAAGAGGGSNAGAGGSGGQQVATLPVTWGENLTVVVGTAGTKGTSGGTGGYGGGGNAGLQVGGSGGGGGGSFIFDTSTGNAALLIATGGGGGAGGDAGEIPGVGGATGAGGDATSTLNGTLGGAGGTTTAGGVGGQGSAGPTSKGSQGTGPATDPNVLGVGGSGGNDLPAPMISFGGGGGGGVFGGGGGGVQNLPALAVGAGGGGAGFLTPTGTALSSSTNAGDGSAHIAYSAPVTTTTSGTLTDASTGDPIGNGCVVFSPAAFPGRTNYTGVGSNGRWSFDTEEFGPFNLAFYTTASGDCSQPILPAPVPSWFIDQPLTGTDEHIIQPPAGAATVTAGTSGIVACLGKTALPTSACAPPPNFSLSGTVHTSGQIPLADVCVFVLTGHGDGAGVAVTDAAGNWTVAGLPRNAGLVLAFVPDFGAPGSPCDSGNGPPPVPAAGALQPVFYNNVWLNLGDPALLNDTYTWGVNHGATLVHAPQRGIDTCITTAPGSLVPRPGCAPAAVMANEPPIDPASGDAQPTGSVISTGSVVTDGTLADTGTPLTPLITTGAVAIALGCLMSWLAARRRGTRAR